jgi:hypothetical protein
MFFVLKHKGIPGIDQFKNRPVQEYSFQKSRDRIKIYRGPRNWPGQELSFQKNWDRIKTYRNPGI